MANTQLLWHTRPRDDSALFAHALGPFGIESIISPVLHIVPKSLAHSVNDMPNGLLLTSRHAAHALALLPPSWRALPVYCVGHATGASAGEHGFTRIILGMRDVHALLPRIAKELAVGSTLLYLAGNETRADVKNLLAPRGINARIAVVYDALAADDLSSEIIAHLAASRIGAVALFSPRTARITCALMEKAGLAASAQHITAYCFSLNVAEEAKKLPWATIHTCNKPTSTAMCELIVLHHPQKRVRETYE